MIGLYTASPVHKKITDAYTFNISAGLGLLQIYRHPTRHQKRKAENGGEAVEKFIKLQTPRQAVQ